MKLSDLVGAAVLGDLGNDPEVFGVRHDSRAVAPGELFAAWRGARHDGAAFAGEAVRRGAVAVVADRARPAEVTADVPWVVAAALRALLADLAARLYGRPDLGLRPGGVTGTNGKSTTVELAAAMLDARAAVGAAGHARSATQPRRRGADRTSPGLRLLPPAGRDEARGARAVAPRCRRTLVQGRVGRAFDAAVFPTDARPPRLPRPRGLLPAKAGCSIGKPAGAR
jgi:UDP-N-acetylmuramoyl-L-alanyl-D-glutamate--2,6-diaminopimelate ligase